MATHRLGRQRAEHAPPLQQREAREAEKRSAIGAAVVHEAIRKEAEEELARTPASLAWSGLAAGLSMGFSLVAEGLLRAHLPDAAWRPLIEKLGYTSGFVIVILARQQLFTENTLTPIISLLARRDLATLGRVARLWGIVLVANLVGALLFAIAIAHAGVFPGDVREGFAAIGREATRGGAGTIFIRAVFAGWLIALLVWMLPAAEASRVPVIIFMTYLVGLGAFAHSIAGSIEAMYLVVTRDASVVTFFLSYLLPALAGNVVGGVVLVALINHAQSVAGTD